MYSCPKCKAEEDERKRIVPCIDPKISHCKITKNAEQERLPKRYVFAWQVWEQAVRLSGNDGMSGMPLLNNYFDSLKTFDITISAEDFSQLTEDVLTIHSLFKAEQSEKDEK